MRAVRRRLFFLALFLALWPAHSKAAITNRCAVELASTSTGATITCTLSNTVSGRAIVVNGFEFGTSNSVSGTESLTCPSAAKIYQTYAGNSRGTYICYINSTASSHGTFTITSTVTCSSCVGFRQIQAWEVDGTLTADTGSAAAAASNTVNFTTANASEWAFSSAYDVSGSLVPGSSFSPIHQTSMNASPTAQADRFLAMSKTTGAAGSNTASFSSSSSFPAQLIAVLAFQISGGSTPQVSIVQSCAYLPDGLTTPATCRLNSTSSGNKGVLLLVSNASSVATSVGSCDTETCVCPSSAGISHVYSGSNWTVNICYSDFASSHATLDLGVGITGGGGAGVVAVLAYEVHGLSSGIDAGSEAGAAATSVSFTTAANNEWAVFIAADAGANALAPGSGFAQGQYSSNFANVKGELAGFLSILTAGSNTGSYTQTGSSTPAIAVAAFGFTSSSTTRRNRSRVF
jgi:hypothetical protein